MVFETGSHFSVVGPNLVHQEVPLLFLMYGACVIQKVLLCGVHSARRANHVADTAVTVHGRLECTISTSVVSGCVNSNCAAVCDCSTADLVVLEDSAMVMFNFTSGFESENHVIIMSLSKLSRALCNF